MLNLPEIQEGAIPTIGRHLKKLGASPPMLPERVFALKFNAVGAT
jgi:hypothetical protein